MLTTAAASASMPRAAWLSEQNGASYGNMVYSQRVRGVAALCVGSDWLRFDQRQAGPIWRGRSEAALLRELHSVRQAENSVLQSNLKMSKLKLPSQDATFPLIEVWQSGKFQVHSAAGSGRLHTALGTNFGRVRTQCQPVPVAHAHRAAHDSVGLRVATCDSDGAVGQLAS